MRALNLALFLLLIAMQESANSAQNSCGRLMSLGDYSATDCKCKGDLKQYGIQSPYKGLRLVAICNYGERLWESGSKEIFGSFFLQGEQMFSGMVRRQVDDSGSGVEITFWDDNFISKQPVFYNPLYIFSFSDASTARAVSQFKMPQLTDINPCWEARVTLSVSEILVIPEGGNYVGGYNALRIDKYRSCSSQRR